MDSDATTPSINRQPIEVPFTLNGLEIIVSIDPAERLLDTLRYRLGMTGSKEGCGEGECGACTVHVDDMPVNSCLIPTYQVRNAQVRTIESIDPGDITTLLGSGATQCGACTPGVVMTAVWVWEHAEFLETHTLRELMAGNLCRCTGYDGIIDGVRQSLEGGQQ